jgi:hypothetical protein
MNTKVLISIATVAGVLTGQVVTADPIARNHPSNAARQDQKDDVQQGAKAEESSAKDTVDAASESSDISRLEREYLADGVLTTAERNELDKRVAAARRSDVQQ